MKKVLLIAAVVGALVAGGALSGFGVIATEVAGDLRDATGSFANMDKDRKDSDAFYHATMPRIIRDPSYDTIVQVWSPREKTDLERDALDEFLARRAKLGAIEERERVLVKMKHHFEAEEGLFHHSKHTEVSAKYAMPCRFSNGSAVIKWSLEKQGAGWGYTALEVADAPRSPYGALLSAE